MDFWVNGKNSCTQSHAVDDASTKIQAFKHFRQNFYRQPTQEVLVTILEGVCERISTTYAIQSCHNTPIFFADFLFHRVLPFSSESSLESLLLTTLFLSPYPLLLLCPFHLLVVLEYLYLRLSSSSSVSLLFLLLGRAVAASVCSLLGWLILFPLIQPTPSSTLFSLSFTLPVVAREAVVPVLSPSAHL